MTKDHNAVRPESHTAPKRRCAVTFDERCRCPAPEIKSCVSSGRRRHHCEWPGALARGNGAGSRGRGMAGTAQRIHLILHRGWGPQQKSERERLPECGSWRNSSPGRGAVTVWQPLCPAVERPRSARLDVVWLGYLNSALRSELTDLFAAAFAADLSTNRWPLSQRTWCSSSHRVWCSGVSGVAVIRRSGGADGRFC